MASRGVAPDGSSRHSTQFEHMSPAADPFSSNNVGVGQRHRYSHFDNETFSLGPGASPEQAKLALEAHLAETERRILDASKLGTTLVDQRKALAERLQEVEKQQSQSDISPELRQRLVEIEKEYNEVGRESARALLPRTRVPSTESTGAPHPSDGRRSVSPSKFESHSTNSPSKLNVPNRKQRNQPTNRVHDIDFVTAVGESLIQQLKELQMLLAEKEESLKSISFEKSKLEAEAEGFHQRLRALDDSEQRYKDENWNLETQVHEHIAGAKDAADREKKLSQSLNVLQAEKSTAQKELDEIKLNHAKLAEDHAAATKHHDTEIGGAKRSIVMAENERGALQRKVDDLMGQNQELAKAVAHHRGRLDEQEKARGLSDEDFETAPDNVSPDHSPPPSPTKGTPRHSMLESETLKSSLHHAHRMIQNLKGNIHRERTEKLELKRMLQDARDELEIRRSEGGGMGSAKRSRKAEPKDFKKPLNPSQLGGTRNSKNEVTVDDTNWEDHDGQPSPTHSTAVAAARVAAGFAAGGAAVAVASKENDSVDTTNDNSEFETANERGTETDDFHTGAEDLSGSDLTETEAGPVRAGGGIVRGKKPSDLPHRSAGDRTSFQSTASTSGEEYGYEEVKTPVSTQPQKSRFRVSRGGVRRSRVDSEEPQFHSSPATFDDSSRDGTPQAAGQTLASELGDLNGGSDDEESMDGTPSRRSMKSVSATPITRSGLHQSSSASSDTPPVPIIKATMVDSGMMTDAWEPRSDTPDTTLPYVVGGAAAGVAGTKLADLTSGDRRSIDSRPDSSATQTAPQWRHSQFKNFLNVDSDSPDDSRPMSMSAYSDMSSQYEPDIGEKLSKFPSPPTSPSQVTPANNNRLTAIKAPLGISSILSEHVEPTPEESMSPAEAVHVPAVATAAPLAYSSLKFVDTEPVESTEVKSPRPGGVIIPRDEETHEDIPEDDMSNAKPGILGTIFGWGGKNKEIEAPVIAEDETTQSTHELPNSAVDESQRALKEIGDNGSNAQHVQPVAQMADESSQTSLTSEQIDSLLRDKSKRQEAILAEDSTKPMPLSPRTGSVATLARHSSRESIGSVRRARAAMADPDFAHDSVQLKRPGSVTGSRRGSNASNHPPLPSDYRQSIAAATQRVGSISGISAAEEPIPRARPSSRAEGSMGPPALPASAYRSNASFRPRTPHQNPLTPASVKSSATARQNYAPGTTEVYTPTRAPGQSRQSSVTSFVTEIDSRFNGRGGMPMPQDFDAGTDPRMIQAITQTMIGEYLWKYTRKPGRGEMSENRHRRYFWVHPYTRTLYWSDRDPTTAGRAELKAKSVAIEAVRVVTDDNHMPPGLHRKSLVVLTPGGGRAVKFTATTGQRHETWFNALSYLLLRTGIDGTPLAESDGDVAANNLTRDDVDEFMPGYGAGASASASRRGPPSLSSYNSRTTRNESPARQSIRSSLQQQQQQQQQSQSNRPTYANNLSLTSRSGGTGTLNRLSSYLKPGGGGGGSNGGRDGPLGSFNSRRSRTSTQQGSIYQAIEVHDSAEDLREIFERQERESDKLENVRACCDGKHDVGSLHHHHHNNNKRGRNSSQPMHTHPPATMASSSSAQRQGRQSTA